MTLDNVRALIREAAQRRDATLADIQRTRESLMTDEDNLHAIEVRRASPDGTVIPQINYRGELTSLWIQPGTAAKQTASGLAGQIMAALNDCNKEATKRRAAIFTKFAPHVADITG